MPRAIVNTGMELEYETFGSPSDPALLLVMGFTAQLTAWDEGFCRIFADAGYFVICFDNRDCGLSTKIDGQVADLGAVMAAVLSDQPAPPVPYTLSDMAADAVGLLDHLGIASAHILGASMGGMIVQHIAIEHPNRVRSMVSVMSMPGEPEVGQPSPEAAEALLAPPPTDRQAYIDSASKWLTWQSKKYRDVARVQQNAARDFDRSFYPEGSTRQLAAIYASGRRTVGLQQLDCPTLVIHGRDDTLITPSGGERTAELIPGAHLLMLADMGHDIPEPLWPVFTDAVLSHIRRAG
ncbi:MAG: alpha/beta fold hydrolase [Actinomycetota bacterium]